MKIELSEIDVDVIREALRESEDLYGQSHHTIQTVEAYNHLYRRFNVTGNTPDEIHEI